VIKREWDDETGIIIVSASGLWTKADVEMHYEALRRMIEPLRAAGRPVRVLSDVTKAERQNPIVESHTLGEIMRTFQHGDRLAILTANPEDKAYARTIIGSAEAATFTSRMAAEMWLLIEEGGR
jgi:hypothetical protein